MRSKRFQVDCDHFHVEIVKRYGLGGQVACVHHPVCDLPGAPNYEPNMDRPFRDKCAECPHNKWQDA